MTTVGYGDKSPKKLPGRIFAVLWVLIGITITSMYIGSLAGTIYSLQVYYSHLSLLVTKQIYTRSSYTILTYMDTSLYL